MKIQVLRALALLLAALAAPSEAQFQGQRKLSEAEQRAALTALLARPGAPVSDVPSCKADLHEQGPTSIATALADALATAAAESKRVVVKVDCYVRAGYTLGKGQEYCRLGFVSGVQAADSGFGLAFLMDWSKREVVTGTVECY